ncbi:MAG: ABC transporter ATP-binding protein [Anaerolineae bacterium]|nr:ABC transporter ATP-binding protein [Anaerolineae bacterium]
MSDQIAIQLSGVGKMYKIYPSRLDNFLDGLGLVWLTPWRRIKPGEFWALRDINLELKKGSRLGIIGRNGAGKSTLLKLITGNLPATEGTVYVDGQVQALLEAGAGFHPEFTGHENIRAALTYQGFNSREIQAATQDIAEFTELGQFLAQPFKTYSAGMQARLVFATATTLRPDILIIDEILGAGDAYFASKSAERMKQLVAEGDASVLLVSHSLDQIVRYCNECIWIERGRIVKRGPSLEVIKAYEEFIHKLEDRRLRAKNQKRHLGSYDPAQVDGYGDAMVLAFRLEGEPGAWCDIAEITLLKEDQIEETLKVGDVQDGNWSHTALVALNGSNWSEPRRVGQGYCRSLRIQPDGPGSALGEVVFYAYALFSDARYAYQVRYRCNETARLTLTLTRNGKVLHRQVELPHSNADWSEWKISLPGLAEESGVIPENGTSRAAQPDANSRATPARSITRWPGEGSLTIEKVLLLGADGQEQAVFPVGSPLILSLKVLAHRDGHYCLVPTATLYRLDGVLVTKFPGESMPLDFRVDEKKELYLDLPPLNLGNGAYVFSVAIFERVIDKQYRYDLIDRSYEFQVVGNEELFDSVIYRYPVQWRLG